MTKTQILRSFRFLLLTTVMVRSASADTSILRLVATELETPGGDKSYTLYSGVFYNDGPSAVQLDLAQMPGGYAGKMGLFLCSVEKWDADAKKWRLGFNNFPDETNETRLVSAGGKLEVCRVALPNLAVRVGDLVRFSLRLSKNVAGAEVVSAPFVAGHGKSPRKKSHRGERRRAASRELGDSENEVSG